LKWQGGSADLKWQGDPNDLKQQGYQEDLYAQGVSCPGFQITGKETKLILNSSKQGIQATRYLKQEIYAD
jgi:hypothetical protein